MNDSKFSYDWLAEFCEDALAGSFERLIVAAWEANCLAKSEGEFWYEAKDHLLRHAVIRAADEAVLDWGCSNGILYFDIPGRGQVSFHIFWDWHDPIWRKTEKYSHSWTEERNYSFEPHWIPIHCVKIALRDWNGENQRKMTAGEIHNMCVRAWIDPASAHSREVTRIERLI